MGSTTFSPQILVEKLNKLNSSQASIETLSHFCIYHMSKAKQVVETWDREFNRSPPEQRLAFLYLANDILQNSRRKGSEFVGEFWKVLPGALKDVMENGDAFGKAGALRLLGIWEERKVFGSHGQILKEEIVGKNQDNNRNGKHLGVKLKQPIGSIVDKIVSGYQVVYRSQMDEDALLTKFRNAISTIEKVEKEIGSDIHSGQVHGSAFVEELQGQQATLRNCIEQLRTVESSRASLVSHLREALQEQESKLAQFRSELQNAQSQFDRAGNFCLQLLAEHHSTGPPGFTPSDRKSSGEMLLSYVVSSLGSEVDNNNRSKEPSGHLPPLKRPKLENGQSYTPIAPFPQPYYLQRPATQQLMPNAPPPPPSSPPPTPPPPPPPLPVPSYQVQVPVPQYIQSTSSITGLPYNYNMIPPPPPPNFPGYPTVPPPPLTGMSPFAPPPTNLYPSFQGSDGNFYSHPSSMAMAPVSRQ